MKGSSESSTKEHWSLIKFVDENIRYAKYPFFIVGVAGVVVAAKSIRLAKKFTSANAIPKEFFRKNFTLYGNVIEVKKYDGSEQSVVFYVDHVPIFSRKFSSKEGFLHVTVPGISLNAKYFPELYKKLESKKVAFTLLDLDENANSALSLVSVRGLAFKIFPRYENVGFWCVENGFASTIAIPYPSQLRECKKFGKYYEKLLALEEKASKKKKGIWSDDQGQGSKSGSGLLPQIFQTLKRIFQFFKRRER